MFEYFGTDESIGGVAEELFPCVPIANTTIEANKNLMLGIFFILSFRVLSDVMACAMHNDSGRIETQVFKNLIKSEPD